MGGLFGLGILFAVAPERSNPADPSPDPKHRANRSAPLRGGCALPAAAPPPPTRPPGGRAALWHPAVSLQVPAVTDCPPGAACSCRTGSLRPPPPTSELDFQFSPNGPGWRTEVYPGPVSPWLLAGTLSLQFFAIFGLDSL